MNFSKKIKSKKLRVIYNNPPSLLFLFFYNNIIATWLSYRILDEESRRVLIERESTLVLNEILPIKLHMVRIVASKFE